MSKSSSLPPLSTVSLVMDHSKIVPGEWCLRSSSGSPCFSARTGNARSCDALLVLGSGCIDAVHGRVGQAPPLSATATWDSEGTVSASLSGRAASITTSKYINNAQRSPCQLQKKICPFVPTWQPRAKESFGIWHPSRDTKRVYLAAHAHVVTLRTPAADLDCRARLVISLSFLPREDPRALIGPRRKITSLTYLLASFCIRFSARRHLQRS